MVEFTEDYLLDQKVKILQPVDGYRASTDAVFLASLVGYLKETDSVLDVGAGTGAVSLCLAHRFPHNNIIGVELQPELVTLANQSATANGFVNLAYLQDDIRRRESFMPGNSFDHVITNPPYAENDMPSPNESKAAAHNMADFSLVDWLHFCLKMLKPYGWLYLIHRAAALSDILAALHGKAGNIKIVSMYSKSGQNAKRVMICAQKCSRAPLQILPGFRVHKQSGGYTNVAESILRDGRDYFTTESKWSLKGG